MESEEGGKFISSIYCLWSSVYSSVKYGARHGIELGLGLAPVLFYGRGEAYRGRKMEGIR